MVKLFLTSLSLASLFLASMFLIGCGANPTPSSTSSSGSGSNPPHSHGDQAATTPTPRIPAYFSNAEEAKPLPAVLDPKQFSNPTIVKAYRAAQENPEVFSQQPCFCYCDAGVGGGEKPHRSLLDCFASDHGVGCPLCVKESLLVDKLHKEGRSASEIRDRIIRREWMNVSLE